MLPLALLLRRPPPHDGIARGVPARPRFVAAALGLSPSALQTLLVIAGVSCCVAMSMPQVHLVAYCGDLGYGAARGAQMLSLMLGLRHREPAHVRRSSATASADCARCCSARRCRACRCCCSFRSTDWCRSTSSAALFGLFQGGIVPSYAIIVREYFPEREAGARVGIVITATLFGMALGGWMSGAIFDLTGSYKAAFVNGILWNLVNVSIAAWLLRRATLRPALA